MKIIIIFNIALLMYTLKSLVDGPNSTSFSLVECNTSVQIKIKLYALRNLALVNNKVNTNILRILLFVLKTTVHTCISQVYALDLLLN